MLGVGFDISKQPWITFGANSGFTGFLDSYTDGLSTLYALERALSTYDGPLARVRRSSDNVEESFYPNTEGGFPDTEIYRFLSPWDNPRVDVGLTYTDFSANTDYASFSDISFVAGDAATISFWIKAYSTAEILGVLGKEGSLSSWVRFMRSSGNVIDMSFPVGGLRSFSFASPAVANTWTHVVITLDTAGNLRCWKDGVESTTGTISGVIMNDSGWNRIHRYSNNTTTQRMDIAEICIAKDSVDQTDVDRLYNQGIGTSPLPLLNNIQGYWKLGDTTDYSGNGRTLTFTGSPTSFNNPFADRTTLRFNGVNGYVSIPQVTLSGEFAISLWYKSSGTFGAVDAILGSNDNTLIWLNATILRIRSTDSLISLNLNTTTGGKNTWHHLFITRDNSNIVSAYIDGVFSNSIAISSDFTFTEIGRVLNSNIYTWEGCLAEITIWDGVSGGLSEAASLYNSGSQIEASSVIANPIRYYKLNELSGTTAVDSGTDGENGTLNGFGTEDGFLTIWYCQNDNTRHLKQSAAASQPKIVDAGTLVTLDGKAAILFDGIDDGLSTDDFSINLTEAYSIWRGRYTQAGTPGAQDNVWRQRPAGAFGSTQGIAQTISFTYTFADETLFEGANGAISSLVTGQGSNIYNTISIIEVDYQQSQMNGYVNNVLDATMSDLRFGSTPVGTVSVTDQLDVGFITGATGWEYKGEMQLLSIWHTDKSAERESIYNSVSNHYN